MQNPAFTINDPPRRRLFLLYLPTFPPTLLTSLFLVSTPHPVRGVSPIKLLKLIFVYKGQPMPSKYRWRVKVTVKFVVFLACSGVSASMAIVCLCGSVLFGALGLTGLAVGLVYGLCYRNWVYKFPIIQRAPFYRYILGFGKAVIEGVKLASVGLGCLLVFVLPFYMNDRKGWLATRDLIIEHTAFCVACVAVSICWELNRHLFEIFLTKRLTFAPTMGSAAAETNPSAYLVEALEDTRIRQSLYLAYLDLCMMSETKRESWRRVALFERTGETYKRVISVCLRPLEHLIVEMIRSSNEVSHEPCYHVQLCVWCAPIASSLTVSSIKEDHYGIAKLSGSNAKIVSTLLCALLSVETFMGKKTNLLSTNKKRYSNAFSMVEILKTSIYKIVSSFHEEMVVSSTAGLLEQEWITSGNPLYGTRELLVQKLRMFIDFQAN